MSENNNKKNPSAAKSPYAIYRKTDVMTSNKETILLMMYGGAIRFLKQGIEATQKNDITEKSFCINKTIEIITELRSTLDFEVGGDFSKQLEALYNFVLLRLTEGAMKNDVVYFNDALTVLTGLNEAWEQAIENVRKEKSQAADVK
jgi:flagellar protein FliS